MSPSPLLLPLLREPASRLRVVTFNLLNDLRFWPERGPLILEGLRALDPDVIALQEVSLPFDNASWLAERLGGYSVHLRGKTGSRSGREALGILSRLPVAEHSGLSYHKQGRVAQRVVVEHGGVHWTIANTHLHWSLYDDRTRRAQVRRLLEWLPAASPTIVCGDFNALPHYHAIGRMIERFTSVQIDYFGGERLPTFPTPLKRGPGVNHMARARALRLLGRALGQDEGWRGTLDYIFVDRSVNVLHTAVVLNDPAPHDPELFPSDHAALLADLAWTP